MLFDRFISNAPPALIAVNLRQQAKGSIRALVDLELARP
jgi:hypothetical protein